MNFSSAGKLLASVGVSIALLGACTTTDPYTGESKISNTALGTGIGAGIGAIGGLFIAKATDNDARKGALIGAGVGALSGAGIGYYMDAQETEIRQQLQGSGVSVTRAGDNIILNMPSNITFDVGQSVVKPSFYDPLRAVAIVLRKYNRTIVDIVGHTDSTGSAQSNQTLSEERALAVAKFVNTLGVDGRRMRVVGMGENQPIASNNTNDGRAQNRRVEIKIAPLVQ